ncbi:MAG: hypothetical protein JW757_13635 [Anaerolineales bacterium]|nr:hypothetical protein [Anaerolineales bacterium]
MSRKLLFVILLAVLIAVLTAGCGPINQRLIDGTAVAGGQAIDSPLVGPQDGAGGGDGADPTVDTDALATQIQAQLDQAAQPTTTQIMIPTDTVMPTPGIPTDALGPTQTPTLSDDEIKLTALAETLIALETGIPTLEPTATPEEGTATPEGPTTTPGPTQVPCLAMQFVADVTYPPYSIVQPNTTFFKTWYVRNVGACTWNGDFAIVHYDGFQLGGITPLRLGGNVAVPPGDYVSITIQLWTGPQTGEFTSLWMMSDDKGNLFGGGPARNEPLVVLITIPGQSPPEFTLPASTAPPFYTPTP